MRSTKHIFQNGILARPGGLVMYVDMNSFFASCEQQMNPELRGKPIGVTAGSKHYAVIIAPSIEAKKYGVKTGMRMNECHQLCPHLIQVEANPVVYRRFHIEIMKVLRSYCDDVLAKSIDEAAMNLTSYRLVYTDVLALGRSIKADIAAATQRISGQPGAIIQCSIGIAPNTFLAKLATELQKPDGLVQLTPENLDSHLDKLSLTDLPGIASRNSRRLEMMGIRNPLQMRYTSQALLRKAFGGIVGYYWHSRLNFAEVDFYTNDYRAMSAQRTTSPNQRSNQGKMEALLVSICTKLEQRLVKAGMFCRKASFYMRYENLTSWETAVRFTNPLQDAMELRTYIAQKMEAFEAEHHCAPLLNTSIRQIGITVLDFVCEDSLQYSLFDNRIKQDKLRKVMYGIKDKYGKYTLRKASEVIERSGMKDAIGFGSVKDLYNDGNGQEMNNYLLEEMDE